MRDRAASRYERGRFARQLLLLGVYALALYGFDWGWAVAQYWSWDGHGKFPILGVKVLTLAPFFVALLLSWVFAYDADRSLFLAAYRQLDADPLALVFGCGIGSSYRAAPGGSQGVRRSLVLCPLSGATKARSRFSAGPALGRAARNQSANR